MSESDPGLDPGSSADSESDGTPESGKPDDGASESGPAAVKEPRSARRMTLLSVGLLVVGVALIVIPGLVKDGVCGLVECADVTPEIAVGRPEGTQLAIMIPEEVAGDLASIRLLEQPRAADSSEGQEQPLGEWIVFRTSDSDPTLITVGEAPDGFDTRTELTIEPVSGTWIVDASFGCGSTLVRFNPEALDPGFVTAGGAAIPAAEFGESARTTLQCSTAAPSWQRILFFIGIAVVFAGAVTAILLAFRTPAHDDPEWYGP